MPDSNALQNSHIAGFEPDKFREMVAERAYRKAEKRSFVTGYELEDWLEAELAVSNQCYYWSQQVE